MNTSPINFEFNTNGVNNTIRVIEIEGEPWFVSADAQIAMGYTQGNYSNIRKKLNDDEKATKRVNTLGGPQNVSIISESGLYKLVMRSGKPEARAFQAPGCGAVREGCETNPHPWWTAERQRNQRERPLPSDHAFQAPVCGAVREGGKTDCHPWWPSEHLHHHHQRTRPQHTASPYTPQIAPHRAGMDF